MDSTREEDRTSKPKLEDLGQITQEVAARKIEGLILSATGYLELLEDAGLVFGDTWRLRRRLARTAGEELKKRWIEGTNPGGDANA